MKLEIKNLSKKFKENVVLENVNLTLEGGNIYGFIGRNGSGKTVLLKIICGFYTPDSGEIILDGINYIKNKSFPDSTRALIEKPNFIPDLTGYENLKLLASIQNLIGKKEIDEIVKKLNLTKEINKKYSKYSLGTKQKLGIAQALMENPNMIILDEPFNGVENSTAQQIRELLKQEKEKGKIIIIATHIKDDIEFLADILYEIDGGQVTQYKKQFRLHLEKNFNT